MGGSSIDDDWELATPANGARTVVLVGRTGNGKSATGNSIIGRKVFKSRASLSGVTSTCLLQSTVLDDGQIINVIDTPGLFDSSVSSEFIGKEIVNCVNLARGGIHAVLVVVSIKARFSMEEATALQSLQTLFGKNIVNYMIVVFTGGDELEEDEENLEEYLERECPEPLKEVLNLCENRRVLFDNKTKDQKKKVEQVQQLFALVDSVIMQNGGQPYTDELFNELKEGAIEVRDQTKRVDGLEGYSKQELSDLKKDLKNKLYEEHLRRITEMVESKLKETTTRLEQQLAAEQAARLKAEENAQEEISKLRKHLEKAQNETEELRKKAQSSGCSIL